MNYTRRCTRCGEQFIIERSVADREKDTQCPICDQPTKRVYDTFMNDYRPTHSRHVLPPRLEGK